MISEKSRKISNAMAENGIIQPEDTAVYAYGMELVISTLISIIAVFVISFLLSKPLAAVLYLAAFIPLRSTAGGYHATTHLYCLITFSASYAILLILALYLQPYIRPLLLSLISLLNLITVLLLSPIGTSKKPMSDEKRKRNRERSIVISVIFLMVSSASFFVGDRFIEYFTYFTMGQLAAMISLPIAAKLKR